jgi:flagellar motor switch protein FliM
MTDWPVCHPEAKPKDLKKFNNLRLLPQLFLPRSDTFPMSTAKIIKPYDLTGGGVPQGKIPSALHVISERWSKQLQATFSKKLKKNITITTEPAMMVFLEEALKDGTGDTYAMLSVVGDGSFAMLGLGQHFTQLCIESLLGGAGSKVAPKGSKAELTPIEVKILAAIIADGMNDFAVLANKHGFPVSVQFKEVDTPQTIKTIFEPKTTFVMLSQTIRCENMQTHLTLFIPETLIRRKMTSSNAKVAPTSPWSIDMLEHLKDTKVEVKAVLGQTKLTFEEILQLQPGTIIELDRASGEPVDILIGDKKKFKANLFVKNQKLCLKITKP